jgi:hypothetical protein
MEETAPYHRKREDCSNDINDLKHAKRDHEKRINSLEDDRRLIMGRLADGATELALLRKDVRMLMWILAAIGTPILSAIGAALIWAMKTAP